MNQESNNFNVNNFNTQGNNGIPNNQPLNNQNFNQSMGFNQQSINPQLQQTPSFQQSINQMNIQPQTPSYKQPIMQETTPQSMNTFESGNVSSFNNKSPKKINLGLIIGIVIAILVIIVAIFLILNFSKSNDENFTENKEVFSLLYEDGKNFYYIDEKNKIYEYTDYKSVEFANGYAVFSKDINGKIVYGVMDKNEKEIIKSGMYTSIEKFDDVKLYKVKKDSLYGVVDSKGTMIIPTEYEYISIISFSGTDTYVFLVEKSDKYYYISSNGNVMTETDNYGMFTTQIKTFPKIKENTDGLVFIDNKSYYNANTGEVIFDNKTNINFEYNILFEEKNSITLYDKNLKLKEKILTPNTTSIDIHKLKSGYVLLIEYINNGNNHLKKYRIYDEDLNLKKEIECPNAKTLTVEEIGEDYFYIKENASSVGKNVKYKTTLYDKELNEYVREGQKSSNCHINNEKEIIFIESDYDKKVVYLYDIKGKNIAKIENHKVDTNYSYGNYIALVETDSSNRFYDIYNFKGELIAEDAKYINSGISGSDSIKYLQRKNDENSVLLENEIEIKEFGYSWRVCGDSLIAYNSESNHIKIYDKKGKLVKEITKVDSIISNNENYIILKNNNKYNIYSIKKNKFVFEIDSNSYEDEFSDDGLYVIELKDGFYNYEGKKLLGKN